LVFGSPLLSKPKKIIYKLRLGFFDILVFGSVGERAFFRIPLRQAASSSGCKGMLVVNLASASVGVIDSIATVGPLKRLILTADILARGSPPPTDCQVPIAFATDLVMGSPHLASGSASASPLLLDAPFMEDVFASDEAPSQLTDATTEAEDLVTVKKKIYILNSCGYARS
jgi:hypothetical protein